MNYEETFSPVARLASIHLILALISSLNLKLHEIGVNTAFLDGELNKEIYMKQPIRFMTRGSKDKMCTLKRFIYGN